MNTLKDIKGILLLLLLTTMVSCTDNNDSVDKSLTGTWSWVSTDGGIAANIHDTPASTGNTIDLKFTSDNKYIYYTNGVLSSQGTYKLATQKSIVDGLNKNVIVFSSNGEMMIEKIDNLNLEMSQNAFDGVRSSYIKK